MTEKWKPTEEQNIGPVSRFSEFFIDELNELQENLIALMNLFTTLWKQ